MGVARGMLPVTMVLKLVLYNPLSCVADRAEYISQIFSKEDIVILPGTGRRNFEEETPVTKYRHGKHVEYSWGYRKGRLCNRSCGISFLLSPSWEKSIRRVWSPPKLIAGRAAAMRARSSAGDFLVVGAYFPPRGSMAPAAYQECVEKIAAWCDARMAEVGKRAIPIYAMDANDSFGIRRGQHGRLEHYAEGPVGPFSHGQEHLTARRLLQTAIDHSLSVATTFRCIPHTYYGTTSRSFIDHILIPGEALKLIKALFINLDEMREVQPINTASLRDHAPVHLVISASSKPAPDFQRLSLDRDKLMEALITGKDRDLYYTAVKEELLVHEGDYNKCMGDHTPDREYALIEQAIQKGLSTVFGAGKKKMDEDYEKYKERRLWLLQERRRLKIIVRQLRFLCAMRRKGKVQMTMR